MDIGTLTGQVAIEDQLSEKFEIMADSVREFAGEFLAELGPIGIGVAGLVTVVGAAAAAVAGLSITIADLGKEGSTILGVENAFDSMAVKAGTTGDVLRENLMEGVKGTIDDMVLMQSTTKLLGSGMKLTGEQALLMGQSARELGKATGTDAAGGLNMLSQALLTGRVRALQQQIGLIDLKKGEEEFAKSIGTTADKLNEAGKLEGKRIAIFEAMKKRVDDLGVSEVSFKEKLEQADTSLDDWMDNLKKGIASSPELARAVDAIGSALVKAFGADSQELLSLALRWVDRFAGAVAYAAPIVIGFLGDTWRDIKALGNLVREVWDLVPDWFKRLGSSAQMAATILQSLKDAAGMTSFNEALLLNFATPAKTTAQAMDDLRKSLEAVGMKRSPSTPGPSKGPGDYTTSPSAKTATTTAASIADTIKLWDQYYSTISKMEGDSLEGKLRSDTAWYTEKKTTLDKTKPLNRNYYEEDFALRMLYDAKQQSEIQAFADKQKDVLTKLGQDTAMAQAKNMDDEFAAKNAMRALSEAAEEAAYQREFQTGTISAETLEKAIAQIRAKYAAQGVTDARDEDFKRLKVLTSGYDALVKANEDYVDLINEQTLTSTDYQIEQNRRWADAQLELFVGSEDQWKDYYAKIKAMEKAKNDGLFVDNRALIANSRTTLQQIANQAWNTWKAMEAAPSQYSETVRAVFKKMALDASKALEPIKLDWTRALEDVGRGVSDFGSKFNNAFGSIVTQVGSVLPFFSRLKDELVNIQDKGQKAAFAIGQALSAVGSVVGAVSSGPRSMRVIGGALTGAMVGYAAASAYASAAGVTLGATTMGISIAVGALAGAIIGWVAANKAAAASAKEATSKILDMKASIIAQYGSMQEAAAVAARFGLVLEDSVGTSGNDLANLSKEVAALDQKLKDLAADVQKYGLTWTDLTDPADILDQATKAAKPLEDSFKRLTQAGYSVDSVVNAMSGDINDWLTNVLAAGTKIPPAMQPILNKLIEMGLLTDANKRKLMGLSDPNILNAGSYEDVIAAAQRYGLELDALGPKINQINIDQVAQTLSNDWKLLTSDGEDVNKVMEAMKGQTQDVLNSFFKFGGTIPESMKPMIDRMIEAGLLTDGLGNKLLDDSKINFAKPITVAVEDLVTAIQKLIDTMSKGTKFPVDVEYNDKGYTGPRRGEPRDEGDQQPSGFASGGYVPSYYPPKVVWTPRGTDTVPAMLTPGERVVTAAQTERERQKPITIPITIQAGNETIARQVVKTFVQGGL